MKFLLALLIYCLIASISFIQSHGQLLPNIQNMLDFSRIGPMVNSVGGLFQTFNKLKVVPMPHEAGHVRNNEGNAAASTNSSTNSNNESQTGENANNVNLQPPPPPHPQVQPVLPYPPIHYGQELLQNMFQNVNPYPGFGGIQTPINYPVGQVPAQPGPINYPVGPVQVPVQPGPGWGGGGGHLPPELQPDPNVKGKGELWYKGGYSIGKSLTAIINFKKELQKWKASKFGGPYVFNEYPVPAVSPGVGDGWVQNEAPVVVNTVETYDHHHQQPHHPVPSEWESNTDNGWGHQSIEYNPPSTITNHDVFNPDINTGYQGLVPPEVWTKEVKKIFYRPYTGGIKDYEGKFDWNAWKAKKFPGTSGSFGNKHYWGQYEKPRMNYNEYINSGWY